MAMYAVNYMAGGLAMEIEVEAANKSEARKIVYQEARKGWTIVDILGVRLLGAPSGRR